MNGERSSLLIVEDDPQLARQLCWALRDEHDVRLAGSTPDGLDALKENPPDLLLLDLCLPPGNVPEEGFQILRAARAGCADTCVVVMSALEEREAALRAVAEGAFDFFSKPVDLATLRIVLGRALERQSLVRENRRLRDRLRERFALNGLVGVSRAMQRVSEAIQRVADSPVTVILQGESGTGKEVVARAIHYGGGRRGRPFVPVHCAALPETLLEAELFGHEKGAFTGAVAPRVGRFEAADGGTLFLDEVACLNPAAQMKLLRVLEERSIERLGSSKARPVDIRLIVASNEDLQAKVARGEFREDLFFRVNVFPIHLPPLRERRDDIPLLAEHFLGRIRSDRDLPLRRFSPEALEALQAAEWRGNVRELLNLVETAALMADGETIGPEDLPASLRLSRKDRSGERANSLPDTSAIGFRAAVEEFEKRALSEAIRSAQGVKAQAARDLGLDSGQMKYLVKKYGL